MKCLVVAYDKDTLQRGLPCVHNFFICFENGQRMGVIFSTEMCTVD